MSPRAGETEKLLTEAMAAKGCITVQGAAGIAIGTSLAGLPLWPPAARGLASWHVGILCMAGPQGALLLKVTTGPAEGCCLGTHIQDDSGQEWLPTWLALGCVASPSLVKAITRSSLRSSGWRSIIHNPTTLSEMKGWFPQS